MPVWCGESGENSNVWFTDAIGLFEKNKIGWAWWPLKKFGLNNPLQIKQNNGYKQLISYWKGQSPKPSQAFAFNALMQLTEDIKAENCSFHKDVIDAMFRQVNSFETIPFKQHHITANTIVFAVDYDLGRNHLAYLDNDSADYHVSTGKRTAGNRGGQYRNDGVDIEACTDSLTNGFNVGWIEDGEWLQYTINVEKTDLYNLNIRIASGHESNIQILVNDVAVVENISLKEGAGDKDWETTTVTNIHLTKGISRFKIFVVKGDFKLNYFEFISIK